MIKTATVADIHRNQVLFLQRLKNISIATSMSALSRQQQQQPAGSE